MHLATWLCPLAVAHVSADRPRLSLTCLYSHAISHVCVGVYVCVFVSSVRARDDYVRVLCIRTCARVRICGLVSVPVRACDLDISAAV
jgi:hypothetical protein